MCAVPRADGVNGMHMLRRHAKSHMSLFMCAHASRSQHYRYGLNRAFRKRRHSHVIVLDDDMQVSPDFLLYFEVRRPHKGHLPCCNYIDRSVA